MGWHHKPRTEGTTNSVLGKTQLPLNMGVYECVCIEVMIQFNEETHLISIWLHQYMDHQWVDCVCGLSTVFNKSQFLNKIIFFVSTHGVNELRY